MLSTGMSMTKYSSQEAYLSGDKKKKKRNQYDPKTSDNGIKSKGWHVRRCQRLFSVE